MKKKGVEKGGSETPVQRKRGCNTLKKEVSFQRRGVWEAFPQPPLPLWVVR
jgi:hypothetical protein